MADLRRDVTLEVDESELGKQIADILFKRANALQRRIIAQAQTNAPVDTGTLARSISGDTPHFSGPFHVEFEVTAKTDYAIYVHEGTHKMRARPFLTRAMRQVAREVKSRRSRV